MKHLTRLTIILALVTAVGLSIVQAQEITIGDLYSTEVIPCPDSITKGPTFNPWPALLEDYRNLEGIAEVEGETYECGVVVVPENYDEPDGRKLELFYARLFSSSQSPAPDPVIYLSGGPGQPASSELAGVPNNVTNLNQARERRDLIFYDQRGSGYSNFLTCGIFPAAFGLVLESTDDPEIAAQIEAIGADPSMVQGTVWGLCALAYQNSGTVDLTQYNSVVSAQDIASVAAALGYDQYNLYGTSYGTRLAQFAMRQFPDKVRSVVLDGVVSVSTGNIALSLMNADDQYVQVFAQCTEDPVCAEAYPNLSERFATLLDKLAQNPLPLEEPIVVNPAIVGGAKGKMPGYLEQIDPSFFMGLAYYNGHASPGLAASIPRLILAVEEGDTAYIADTVGVAAPVTPPSPGQITEPDPQQFVADQPYFQPSLATLLEEAKTAVENANSSIENSWIGTTLLALEANLLIGNDEESAVVSDLLDLAVLPTHGPDSQALIDYANEHLGPASATVANAIVGKMTRNDVRRTMWAIQDVTNHMGLLGPESRAQSYTMHMAFNCADDIAFFNTEATETALATSPFPQLISMSPKGLSNTYFFPCKTYPTPLDKSVTEAVTVDIPALIFQEELDTNTPFSWGVTVYDALPNAYFVPWRTFGHVAAGHDGLNCAGDIAAAFYDDPSRQPNISCSESAAYRLQWVLPE